MIAYLEPTNLNIALVLMGALVVAFLIFSACILIGNALERRRIMKAYEKRWAEYQRTGIPDRGGLPPVDPRLVQWRTLWP